MRRWWIVGVFALVAGCAGFNKSCSQFSAASFGSDWIVVQYTQDGKPFHCWKLTGASVESSQGGNVDWQDPKNGHLMHITGWENRVQVQHKDWPGAGKLLNIDVNQCDNGVYPANQGVK
jgi:hypothetical protein